jgi:TPR repeat protein
MSALLDLDFYSAGDVRSVPIVVEIVDESLEPAIRPAVVTPETGLTTVLPLGRYLITARLPSGKVLQTSLVLTDSQRTRVTLNIHDLAGEETTERPTMLSRDIESNLSARPVDESVDGSAWVRLWEAGPGGWYVEDFNGMEEVHSSRLVLYKLNPHNERAMLQFGGHSHPWTFSAIPSGYQTDAAFGFDGEGNLIVSLITPVDTAEALLSYMTTNAVTSGQALLDQTLKTIYHLDPLVSIIAGLYLLRLNRLDDFRDLVIPRGFEGSLSVDASILRAWQNIHAGRTMGRAGNDFFRLAADELLRAVGNGLPVYTESLVILTDGLALFSGERDDNVYPREVLRTSQRVYENYLASADRHSAILTFRAASPTSPTQSAKYGFPYGRQKQNPWFPEFSALGIPPIGLESTADSTRRRRGSRQGPGKGQDIASPFDFVRQSPINPERAYEVYEEALSLRSRDPEKAEHLLREAVHQGSLPSLLELASLIKDRNPPEAENLLRSGVEAGSAEAMSDLGMLVVDQDPLEAEWLFRRAARAGDLIGMNNLAVLIIRKDATEALRLLEIAAAGGLAKALENLEKVTRLGLQRGHHENH